MHRDIRAVSLVCVVGVGVVRIGAAHADLGVPIGQTRPVSNDAGLNPIYNYAPIVATDGHGLWIAAWQLSRTAAYAGFQGVYARSLDSGINWSASRSLNPNASSQTTGDTRPGIASDGHGHWVAVLQSTQSISGGVRSQIKTVRSIDNGVNWSAAVPLNPNAAANTMDELEPAVATDGQGRWIAVWRRGDGSSSSLTGFDIVFSRSDDNGASWTAPLPRATGVAFDSAPRIVADGAGDWIIVWSSSEDCFFARSTEDGANWSMPAYLNPNSATAASDIQTDVTADGQGHWVAVWSSNDTFGGTLGANRKILVARTLDNGANWSLPVPLSTPAAAEFDSQPSITSDRHGNWAAAWSRANKPADKTDIVGARSIDFGASWSSPSVIGTIANGDTTVSPRIATDGRGEWVTIWRIEEASLNSHVVAAHIGLPDCNQNQIGDPLETGIGLSLDINHNSVPDLCEINPRPPPPNGGCGVGLCGANAAAFTPLTAVALVGLRRRRRR